MVRLFSGKAGQAIVKVSPRSASSASATGPMLPASVESKVEQYLKTYCRAPAARRLASTARDIATASAAGIVRDLSATTIASASGSGAPASGTPIAWTVRIPWRTSVFARSVAPVRSSAMQPRSRVPAAMRRATAGDPTPRRLFAGGRDAGDGVGTQRQRAGLARLGATLLEEGRIRRRRAEAVLVQFVNDDGALAGPVDLHRLLAAGKVGEPQHQAAAVAIAEAGDRRRVRRLRGDHLVAGRRRHA